ncbi:hypothetical protein CEE36_02340 [candidate division TA06 bacterium B3_TA06]|uniref:Yip1 domain-containing protein n=1 Tax=candidate division TA06 bacterium B3_TA06 TaxID=2012487 RepID=A0A532V9X8_UNCT6|nr:MAG: hypothetical protein CEE36_02340 [candidate division TA06 bacterium B3_TA06]
MSEGRRLLSVFVAPNELFTDLGERPRWLVPFIILILAAAVASLLPRLLLPTEVWLDAMRQQLPGGVEMSQEQMAVVTTTMRSPVSVALNALVGILISGGGAILATLFFWALFSILGGKISFTRSFAVVSYSSLIKVLGMVLIVTLTLILQRLDIQTSFALLPALKPNTYLYRLAAQVDFFTVWRLIIMGLGFSVVANVPKVKSYLSVIIPWILLSLAMAALRFGFSR